MTEIRTPRLVPRRPLKTREKVRNTESLKPSLHFTRKNYILMGVAGAMVVAGYLLMAGGGTTFPTVLIVSGYLGMFPLAIMLK